MTKPRAIMARMGPHGLRVEYVKTRGILRFRAEPASDGTNSEGTASGRAFAAAGGAASRDHDFVVTVKEFRDQLGMTDSDLAPPSLYLLFASRTSTGNGGTRDLLGTWESEIEARAAFRKLRQEPSWLWAEVAIVQPGKSCEHLCWFGIDRPVSGLGANRPAVAKAEKATPGRLRRLRRNTRSA